MTIPAADLLQRIHDARVERVEVQGFGFMVRLPTQREQLQLFEDLDLSKYKAGHTVTAGEALDLIERAIPFVGGWELTGDDLVEGGGADVAEFDHALLAGFLDNRLDVGTQLAYELFAMIGRHQERMAEEKKPSGASSTSGSANAPT